MTPCLSVETFQPIGNLYIQSYEGSEERQRSMTLSDEIVRREGYGGRKGFLKNVETALNSIEKEVTNTSKMP